MATGAPPAAPRVETFLLSGAPPPCRHQPPQLVRTDRIVTAIDGGWSTLDLVARPTGVEPMTLALGRFVDVELPRRDGLADAVVIGVEQDDAHLMLVAGALGTVELGFEALEGVGCL